MAIQDYGFGTSQAAQTTLQSVIGQADLDELLVSWDEINRRPQKIIDDLTNPWGVKVTLVEVKDWNRRRPCGGPWLVRQSPSGTAGKGHPRKGRVRSRGDAVQAVRQLREEPAAMQLRTLSTMSQIASDRTTTVIFPLPMETFSRGRWRSEARMGSSSSVLAGVGSRPPCGAVAPTEF